MDLDETTSSQLPAKFLSCNSSGSIGVSSTKLQAQLLESHSQVLSLENEVDLLRQRLSEEKIKKGSSYVTEARDVQLVQRCHKVSLPKIMLSGPS